MNIFKELKDKRHLLNKQTLKTIKGQALAGDIEGAKKGLQKALERNVTKSDRFINAHRETRYKTHEKENVVYKELFNKSLRYSYNYKCESRKT